MKVKSDDNNENDKLFMNNLKNLSPFGRFKKGKDFRAAKIIIIN